MYEEVEVSYQREYLFCIFASYFRVLLAVAFMIAPFDLTHGLKSFCDEVRNGFAFNKKRFTRHRKDRDAAVDVAAEAGESLDPT